MSAALSLGPLLAALREAGLRVGVGEVERIHRVFSLVPAAGNDTRRRLKSLLGAVLVKSEAERDVMERVCDAWLNQVEYEDVPAPLRRTTESPLSIRREEGASSRPLRVFLTGVPPRRRLVVLLGVLALTVAITALVRLAPWERPLPETAAPPPAQATPIPDQESVVRRRRFAEWTPELTVKPTVWTGWPAFGLGVGALLTAGGLWLSLRRRRYLPAPAPIPEHRGPPRILLPPSAPHMELVDTDQQEAIVWGIGQFLSEEPTRRVDLGATVRETALDGGLLHLVFEPARYQREVWLWVDEAAEDPTIRVLGDEVEATLAAHGLPVERASFRGVPERLGTEEEGEVFAPREVDERREGAIIAVLTDGRLLSRLCTADDRAVRIDALLRLLSRWPRVAFVGFSGGTNDLRRRLGVHGVEAIAPEELPAFLGALKTAGTPVAEGDPLWAGACALSPAPVAERTAFELRRRLGLGGSPWTFRSLRNEAGGPPDRLFWSGLRRARAVNWLVESEAAFTEDGINPASRLAQALDFWEERFDEEIGRRRQEAWAETPGGQHLRMERELLRLWRRPAEAVRELYRFYGGALRDAVRKQLAGLAPRRRSGKEHVQMPWAWEGLSDDVRVMLLEMGLGGTLPEETLRRPGRVWLGIGAALGLAAGAFAVATTKPWAVPGVDAECRPVEGVDENGMEFVRICAGVFQMGSTASDPLANADEMPAHLVKLGEFWIGKYEVTAAQYQGLGPKSSTQEKVPAGRVSWNDAVAFCEKYGYRLPTEAEWEYAARAGTRTPWSFGADESDIGRYAWYGQSTRAPLNPVGQKLPNPWGLHDMHGNAWEWVADWYGPYSDGAEQDPIGPTNGPGRVLRGGSFGFAPRELRSAARNWSEPNSAIRLMGFRCVRGSPRQP